MSLQFARRLYNPVLLAAVCVVFISSSAVAQNVSFNAGRDFPASLSDTQVSLVVGGDFNGDGKMDLVTTTGSR